MLGFLVFMVATMPDSRRDSEWIFAKPCNRF